MDLDAVRAELEQDLTWRTEEIRFFHNRGMGLDEAERRRYRRALILILYSHFEGYCKFCFLHYIRTVNDLKVRCLDANEALAAATLTLAFQGLRDTQKKNPLYRRQLPDDPQLHRFAREREFIGSLQEFSQKQLKIPDESIDTESNLKPEVLRAALYRLGLNPFQFDEVYADIGMLVGLRNNIAHGATKQGIDKNLYERYEKSAFRVMAKVAADVVGAIEHKEYLRPDGAAG